MLDDLIDLYYYIRSTKNICAITGWSYETSETHTICLNQFLNPKFERVWDFKITVGDVNYYRQIFLSQNHVTVYETGTSNYAVAIPGFITENESDTLMIFVSTDEIAVMNQILLEMRKLLKRSTPE